VLKDSTGTLKAERTERDTNGLVILSTHTGFRLDPGLSTRVLVQELTHDEELARAVHRQKARQNAEAQTGSDPFRLWRIADSLLEPVPVRIPYLARLAELFPTKEERYHRDYGKAIVLIKASALWHQYQRERTVDGAIVADERDYRLVYDGLGDIFVQSTLPVSRPVLTFLELVKAASNVAGDEIEQKLGLSDRSLRRYIVQAQKAGFLEAEGRGASQTFKVIEIPKATRVLPSPELLFQDIQPSPCVQMSETEQALDNQGSALDMAGCPEMSECPKPDNWTELDKTPYPAVNHENTGAVGDWTTGQSEGTECDEPDGAVDLSDCDFEVLL
jgi:hypothetical protein